MEAIQFMTPHSRVIRAAVVQIEESQAANVWTRQLRSASQAGAACGVDAVSPECIR